MGKTKEKAKPITGMAISFDLFDLPTAQHKAGLAGLILQIRSMKDRGRNFPEGTIPVVEKLTPTTATIRFTESSVQSLFDDLYDAAIVEVGVKSKWQGQVPKRIEEIEEKDEDGKLKKVKRFIYDVTQPCGHFLAQHIKNGTETWLKLWRDMLWAIPRGIPATRIPFEQRAKRLQCKEGQDAWKDLVKVQQARQTNGFHTAKVASSLWLGAQATNAEAIPFEGRAEQSFLLHFWPLTALIFVPQQIDHDGAGDFVGYVLAIPEVNELENFLVDYPLMLSQLGKETRGYRPAEAVIDLPAQGALAFLEHLARLASREVSQKQIKYAVGSIEFVHLVKIGNNIKSMAAGRIVPMPDLIAHYLEIVGRPGHPAMYRNPLFRRSLMVALLNNQEWYEPMAAMLSERPWPFFVRSTQSPQGLPWFWQDAAEKFRVELDKFHEEVSIAMATPDSKPDPQDRLPSLVYRLVQNFIYRKTELKSGQKWESFKEKKIKDEKTGKERVAIPKEYSDAKEKIASSTFLEMRSRRDQEFVNHFTAVFGSVGQYLPEDDFQVVAHGLLTQPDSVKTLTLLALSANS
jgi:CRISPR-associated protein Cmx8